MHDACMNLHNLKSNMCTMTHWITRIHEINRSCVDVRRERKRLVPRRVPKTKFPTKLREQGWNNLINSPKHTLVPKLVSRGSALRALSSLTTVKACRGVTTPLLPLLHRDVPGEALTGDPRATWRHPQQLSLPGHTPRNKEGK